MLKTISRSLLAFALSAFVISIASAATYVIGKSFVDSSFFIVDEADNTKVAAFQASGITTGTTRTITIPDQNGTLAMLSDIQSPSKPQVVISNTFESLDGYDVDFANSGAASLTAIPGLLQMETSATAGSYLQIVKRNQGGYAYFDYNPKFSINAKVQTQGTDYIAFLGLADPTIDGTGLGALTRDHVGFIIERTASGSATLTASSGDGTAQQTTAISWTAGSQDLLSIVVSSGSSVEFYVNGILEATHTTRVPDGSPAKTVMNHLSLSNKSTATQTIIRVSHAMLSYDMY